MTSTSSRLGIVLAVALGAGTASRADEPQQPGAAAVHGSAIRSAGAELLASSLTKLGPLLAERAARTRSAGDDASAKLEAALAALPNPAIRAAYPTPLAFVWTEPRGLSAAGERAVAFLAEAPLHGVAHSGGPSATGDRATPGARIAAWIAATGRTPPPAPALAPQQIEAAWDASAGQSDRLSVATKAVADALGPPAPLPDPELRVAAETSIAEEVARLVAELPPHPRTQAVLQAEKGEFYVSPDIVWRSLPPAVATPEAVKAAFEAARAGGLEAHLAALEPQHPQYQKLLAAAKRYQTMCEGKTWKQVLLAFEKPGPPVKGKVPPALPTAATVSALQERLAAEGYYAGPANGQLDEATSAALTTYREAHQLSDKQLVDADLATALNVPCGDRLATLELNVRRWRYSAWKGQPTRVEVNLAAQELRYSRQGELALLRRTVVGSSRSFVNETLKRRIFRNATPILQDEIVQVIVNPEWNVPQRIAREELEPEMTKDADYMTKHHMRAVPGNGGLWYKQDPGPWNALGQMKILFPNSESVYLHDTPGKAAFKLPVRALSHGCVRVQGVVDLGTALLKADAEASGHPFDEKALAGAIASSRMLVYALQTPVPVFLEYYTASVDDAGVVRFHPDIYGYDADLAAPPVVAKP